MARNDQCQLVSTIGISHSATSTGLINCAGKFCVRASCAMRDFLEGKGGERKRKNGGGKEGTQGRG